MSAYYNEFDPFAAAWLRQLIERKLIADGVVDERPIQSVRPDELRDFTQCHFFAGIGGWSYALRLAGWPDDRPVWTGSCPCQPFSSAGKQKGKADERHLWPVWYDLIRECRPSTIFGEQVASAIAHGWLDDVYQGLEAEGYACGSAVLPACSVGAPHKRDRLWFVADNQSNRWNERDKNLSRGVCGSDEEQGARFMCSCTMGNAEHDGSSCGQVGGSNGQPVRNCAERQDSAVKSAGTGEPCNVADSIQPRLEGHARHEHDGSEPRRLCSEQSRSAWQGGVWIDCPDGKQRLVEPSIPLLADGVRNRVGKLRGYGNAIVPQVAAEFIIAFCESSENESL